MDEYIDKNAAVGILEAMSRSADCECIKKRLEKAAKRVSAFPAADVAPVRHGRWDDSGRYTFPSGAVAVRCTNCGCALTESEHRLYNWSYCPVCGAKMDGGDSDAKSV